MFTRRSAIAAISAAFLAQAADPMTVRDLSGKPLTITPGKNVTVVTFISTQCPISNDYNDRMSALYKEFSSRGVNFFFVNANSTEPAPLVQEHANSHCMNRILKIYQVQRNSYHMHLSRMSEFLFEVNRNWKDNN